MLTDAYQHTVNAIIQDPLIHDNLLVQTAQSYLRVLTRPAFAHFNQPLWVTRTIRFLRPLEKVNEFAMSKLFDAMYNTTERHRLMKARRFVLAAICACGQNIGVAVASALEDAPVGREDKSEALAAELSRLGSLWVAYLLWPFLASAQSYKGERDERNLHNDDSYAYVPSALRHSHSPIDEEEDFTQFKKRAVNLKKDLLMRDNRTCLFTGAVDPEVYLLHPTRILNIAAVLPDEGEPGWDDQTSSKATTFDLFRRFCEIDEEDIEIVKDWFNPQNALLLEANTRYFFELFLWRLHPTDIPNTYRVVICEGYGPAVNDYFTFVDHSADFTPISSNQRRPLHDYVEPHMLKRRPEDVGIDLPRPSLLRAHAAIADVLDLSGLKGLFRAFYRLEVYDNIPDPNGSSFMRSVVDYEGPALCFELELSEAAAALDHTYISMSRSTTPTQTMLGQ